jgi:hypothetical protein
VSPLQQQKGRKTAAAGGHSLKDWQFWPTTGGVGGLQHYAAYPIPLAELAIRAGTSERGVCPNCQAPWARVVERAKVGEREKTHTRYAPLTGSGNHGTTGFDGNGMRYDADYRLVTETIAWRPTCTCNAGAPVPAVVLDPFVGSGTTLIAADRLGRSAIGIDVQPTYIDLAAGRARRDAPLFAEVSVERLAETGSKQRDLRSVLDEQEGQGEHRPSCGFYEAQVNGMDRPWGACDCGLVNHDDD